MSDISKLNSSIDGSPFARISAGSENASTLCYTPDGAPWNADGDLIAPVTGHIKSINGVAWEHVDSYNLIAQAHIDIAGGIQN